MTGKSLTLRWQHLPGARGSQAVRFTPRWEMLRALPTWKSPAGSRDVDSVLRGPMPSIARPPLLGVLWAPIALDQPCICGGALSPVCPAGGGCAEN